MYQPKANDVIEYHYKGADIDSTIIYISQVLTPCTPSNHIQVCDYYCTDPTASVISEVSVVFSELVITKHWPLDEFRQSFPEYFL